MYEDVESKKELFVELVKAYAVRVGPNTATCLVEEARRLPMETVAKIPMAPLGKAEGREPGIWQAVNEWCAWRIEPRPAFGGRKPDWA